MRRAFLFAFLLLLPAAAPAAAQGTLPLVGPLVAVNTGAQDRIILYDIGGDNQRELSFGPGWHQVWDFSPDGCHIAFTLSDGFGPARLFSARIDGRDARELVQVDDLPPEAWGVWEPDWSPDGGRIAFTMWRDTPDSRADVERTSHIAWIPAAGGAPAFYSVTGDEHNPVWSPDGRWLAYISFQERVAGATPSATAAPTPRPLPGQARPEAATVREADLWMVSADGETKYPLTAFPTGSVRAPRWSPDGELVGFIYAPTPNNDQLWMIANSPDAIPTQLSFIFNLTLDLTWLPDGTAMLAAIRDFHGVTENRLWQIPLVGNADHDAAQYLDDPALTHADYPRFSADGRWLAHRSAYNLVLVDTVTRSGRLLDVRNTGNTPPVWSPAGFRGEALCPA